MTRYFVRAAFVALLIVFAAVVWLRRGGGPPAADTKHDKQLVVSVRSAPQSFNWFTRHDATTYLVSLLTQATLVRINRATQVLEPWLAERWQRSDDGSRYTVTLKPDVVFSDGAPLTTADVLFSFEAAFDADSLLADVLTVDGVRVKAEVVDERTLAIVFPRSFGPGLRILDGLPILPKHKLQVALQRSAFGSAWQVSVAPSEIVGLGPFVLLEHRSGEQLVFGRNPRYFRRDDGGAPLPRLDRLVVQVLPDQDTQLLALQSGESDGSASEVRPTDYALIKSLADNGQVQLFDLGPGMDPDGLWVNLKPGAFEGDSRKFWIQRDELRQAISLGVDRHLFVETVFSGAAVPVFGPVTPANSHWLADVSPSDRPDREMAKARLAAIGLADRDGDGMLDDIGSRHARLTLLTQKGQSSLERGAAALRDQLRGFGLTIDVVPMEPGALIQRFLSGSGYDAVYFNLTTTDTDPASQLDFWKSGGPAHVWNLGPRGQATAWEREIDDLMSRQSTTVDETERQRLFAQVQAIFSAHVPMVHFAVPRVFVAVSKRVTGLVPAVARPQWLWAADTIDVVQ